MVEVPGSKSVTNRALVLAAVAEGPSRIRQPLRARDTKLMVRALKSLGVSIRRVDDDWFVTPKPLQGKAHVDVGLAGTVMRFVPPVAALARGDVRFDGDPRARVRPMSEIIEALETLGAQIDDDGRGTLPFTIRGQGALPGGRVRLDAGASSQFVSALLLSGARYDAGVRVEHRGGPVPSMPHIRMTVSMLRESGVDVAADDEDPTRATWTVQPGPVRALDRLVEPDLSNAGPFLAAAMVTAGRVRVPGWPLVTTQAGDALRAVFTDMGATTELDEGGLTLTGPQQLAPLDVDLHDVGELTPVLAAVCALADGTSRLRGIGHLRGHETDRLLALATELTALGADVAEKGDGLRIRPRPLHGGVVRTYDDHRMATAAAVLGLVVPGIEVEDVATTTKTMPDFVDRWTSMLAGSASA